MVQILNESKEKQLKGFIDDLAELSKKYGILIYVKPQDIIYAKLDEVRYKINNNLWSYKIQPQVKHIKLFKLDEHKQYSITPQKNQGFYLACLQKFTNIPQALEHWKLVHSLLVQISGENAETIAQYLDNLRYENSFILLKNKSFLIHNIISLYFPEIGRSLTKFMVSSKESV